MPAQRSQSEFAKRHGSKFLQAYNNHKDDTDLVQKGGFNNLPAGTVGIARLTHCSMEKIPEGQTNAGEWRFRVRGAALRPLDYKGETVAYDIPLYDTPSWSSGGSLDEHWGDMLSNLRTFGVDTSEIDVNSPETSHVFQTAVELGGCFKFRITEGKTQTEGKYAGQPPMKFCRLLDRADEPEDDDGGDVDDATAEAAPAPSRNGRAARQTSPRGAVTEAFNEFEEEQAAEETQREDHLRKTRAAVGEETGDEMDALAEVAEAGDGKAQGKLRDAAKAAGLSSKAVLDADSWADVVTMIQEAGEGEETAEDGEEQGTPPARKGAMKAAAPATEAWAPSVGECLFAKPNDPKTKRPMKEAVEVEVTAVDKKAKTVTAELLDDRKVIYRGVPWSVLEAN